MKKKLFLEAAIKNIKEKREEILKNHEFYTNIGEYYNGFLMGIVTAGIMAGCINPEEKYEVYDFLKNHKF